LLVHQTCRWLQRSLLVLAVGALTACGAAQAGYQVAFDAAKEVAAAKAAGAEKYAPYEYTSAQLYLHKAREEQGYADNQAAISFAKKAAIMAKKAKKLALEQAGMESQTPGVAPIDPSATPAPVEEGH
jgi:hypothetical protein